VSHNTACASRRWFHALMPTDYRMQKEIEVCTGPCGGLFNRQGLGWFKVGNRPRQRACGCCLRRLGFDFRPGRDAGKVFET
jgi:hypothetical protein